MLNCKVKIAMQCNDLSELTTVLRENGDKILDASSKLSLSTTLLNKMNESFTKILKHSDNYTSFQVINESNNLIDQFLDLQLLYDFVQKTIALKLLPDPNILSSQLVDINLFHNLKLLEVHRYSLNLVKGLKRLRTQLEYLTCMRSVNTLREVLENCGADKSQGFIWSELKEATFSHNGLDNLDTSLEFVPQLHSIDLSHNQLHDAQSVNCLSNLKYLNLGFNQIEHVPVFSGQLCNMLQVLILRNNYIDDIKELDLLVNLRELDLSHNCLIEHKCLSPITSLSVLERLNLQGNPLSYHPQHRHQTAKYLHITTASAGFTLDNTALSKSELRLVGSLHPMYSSLERSSSFNSTITTATVVPSDAIKTFCQIVGTNLTSDMESSTCSGVSNICFDAKQPNENNWIQNKTSIQDGQGMQDSGFVPGPRPMSPSACSIESTTQGGCTLQVLVVAEVHKSTNNNSCSATSLHDNEGSNEQAVRYCESDIEVLSNPSQSSIEVLSNTPGPRYVHSASAIVTQRLNDVTEKNDLNRTIDEMHGSL